LKTIPKMTKDFVIEEFTLDDGRVVQLQFTAGYNAEDHGIGPYEYWGSRGFDRDWVYVCEEIMDVQTFIEDDDIFEELHDKEQEKIKSWCEEHADENAPICER